MIRSKKADRIGGNGDKEMSEVKLIIPDKSSINIDRDDVLRRTGCGKDNPHYEEFIREFEELLPTVQSAINPRAALGFFDYPGFSDVKRKTEGSKNTGFGRSPARVPRSVKCPPPFLRRGNM